MPLTNAWRPARLSMTGQLPSGLASLTRINSKRPAMLAASIEAETCSTRCGSIFSLRYTGTTMEISGRNGVIIPAVVLPDDPVQVVVRERNATALQRGLDAVDID